MKVDHKTPTGPLRAEVRKDATGAGSALPATHRRDMRLGYLIHDASRLRRKSFDQLMKPIGVTRAQWWILAHLSRRDGMMQTELAKLLDIGKASLGSVLDRLEAGGWIKRNPDRSDGRVKRLYLTNRSRKLLESMNAAELVFNEHVLRGISEGDRELLVKLLSQITRTLSTLELEASAEIHKWPLKEALSLVDQATD